MIINTKIVNKLGSVKYVSYICGTMSTEKLQKLVNILREINFHQDLRKYLNLVGIPKYCFPYAKEYGLTISQQTEEMEDSKRQHTVYQTVRLSYEGIKTFFVRVAPDILEKKTGGRVKILKTKDCKSLLESESKGDKIIDFDLIFEIDGEILLVEMKVTQGKKGWSGATHSTSKSPNYLLISIDIDKEKIVEDGQEYVKGMFMLMSTFGMDSWMGTPKDDSSWSSLSLPTDRDFTGCLICGSLGKKGNDKNYRITLDCGK